MIGVEAGERVVECAEGLGRQIRQERAFGEGSREEPRDERAYHVVAARLWQQLRVAKGEPGLTRARVPFVKPVQQRETVAEVEVVRAFHAHQCPRLSEPLEERPDARVDVDQHVGESGDEECWNRLAER